MTEWMYEWERRMTPLVASAISNSWVTCLPFFAPCVKDQVFLAEKRRITAYFGTPSFMEMGEAVLTRVLSDGFLKNFSAHTGALSEKLSSLGKRLPSLDPASSDDFDLVFSTYWQVSCPVVTIRSFNRIGFSHLDHWLSQTLKDPSEKSSALVLLTAPTRQSLSHREHREFDALLELARKDERLFQLDAEALCAKLPSYPDFQDAIRAHLDSWSWFPCGYDNEPPWDEAFLVGQLSRALNDSGKANDSPGTNSEKRNALLEQLQPPATIRLIADALSEFTYFKDFIREYLNLFQFRWQPYLRGVSEALGLSGFDCTDLLGKTVSDALKSGKPYRGPLLGHHRYALGVMDGVRFVKVENEAEGIFSRIQPSLTRIGPLKGVCANPGTADGNVQVFYTSNDYTGQTGFILVTTMTTPELMHAMKNAKAIVTDEGGITCHAAIVARELGIPCLVGTKTATKILKNGDRVQVDATSGTVTKLA